MSDESKPEVWDDWLYRRERERNARLQRRIELLNIDHSEQRKRLERQIYNLEGYQWRARNYDLLLELVGELDQAVRLLLGIRGKRDGAANYPGWKGAKRNNIARILVRLYSLLDWNDE